MRFAFAGVAALSVLLSGCNTPAPQAGGENGKEYFAESEYGVKASPRVASASSGIPRGGGRYQVGKPYQIKGRWYKPKEEPNYVAEGAASWYGKAFHGRLTANGETYDMTHLTAAHPTMPLPSYARVTNLKNGSSVVVRVNDRGPFAGNRVIDLSRRAAEMLDYKNDGVAKVRVEYVGPAPLHGQDDHYLMASYRPSGETPDPSDGLPTGVMVAMNGPTPSRSVSNASVIFASQSGVVSDGDRVALPATGPLVPDRPKEVPNNVTDLALLSYADRRVSAASRAFDAIVDPRLDEKALAGWWARQNGQQAPTKIAEPFINLGTWASRADAERLLHELASLGKTAVTEATGPEGTLFVASLVPDGRAGVDEILRAAWRAGAVDAFAVRE